MRLSRLMGSAALIAALAAGCGGSNGDDQAPDPFRDSPNRSITGAWRQVSETAGGISQACPGTLIVPTTGGGIAVQANCYSGDTIRFDQTGRASYTLNGGLYAQGTYSYDPIGQRLTLNFESPSPRTGTSSTVPAQISFDGTTLTVVSPFIVGVTSVFQRQ